MSARIIVALIALGLAVIARPVSAQQNDGFQFRTEAAEARYQVLDDNGIETSYWVYGADDVSPERLSKTIVSFSIVDTTATDCGPGPKAQQEPGGGCALISAECYGELDDAAFGVDKHQLDAAWLSATLLCYEHVSGSEIVVTVSVDWTATGARQPLRVNELYHLQGGPYTYTRHLNATSRPAVATGSISWEGGSLTLGPEAAAWIADAQEIITG